MEPVTLCDDRLVLRLPREGDVEDITRACQDETLARWPVDGWVAGLLPGELR